MLRLLSMRAGVYVYQSMFLPAEVLSVEIGYGLSSEWVINRDSGVLNHRKHQCGGRANKAKYAEYSRYAPYRC